MTLFTELTSFFPPGLTTYSPNHAVVLAKLARLAYLDKGNTKVTQEKSLEYQMTQLGLSSTDYECLSQKSTQALVAAKDNIVVVAFRGTELKDVGDWIADLDGQSTPFQDFHSGWGSVHKGFMNALEVIHQEIFRYLEPFQTTESTIFLTGHSLGGALATLSAAELKLKGYPVQGLYTFGSPRVGDEKFAHLFDQQFGSQTFRFVNDKDIVTRVAPTRLGYKHVNDGAPRMLGIEKLLHEAKEAFEAFEMLNTDKWYDLFKEIKHRLWEGIADHDMAAYEQYLMDELTSQHRSETANQLPDRSFSTAYQCLEWSAA